MAALHSLLTLENLVVDLVCDSVFDIVPTILFLFSE